MSTVARVSHGHTVSLSFSSFSINYKDVVFIISKGPVSCFYVILFSFSINPSSFKKYQIFIMYSCLAARRYRCKSLTNKHQPKAILQFMNVPISSPHPLAELVKRIGSQQRSISDHYWAQVELSCRPIKTCLYLVVPLAWIKK